MAFKIVWIFKALQVVGAISKWSETALADGKVTLQEGVELLGELGTVLGLPLDLEIPGVTVPEKLKEILEAKTTESANPGNSLPEHIEEALEQAPAPKVDYP